MLDLWTWTKAKVGRIITATGVFVSGIETFDITPVKDPLESFIGHKGVQALVISLFVFSFVRHQYVASKIAPK